MVIINLEFWEFLTENQEVVGGSRTSDFDSLNRDSFSVNGRTLSRIQSRINSSATGLLDANVDGSSSVEAGAGFVISVSSISGVATTPGTES
jgi:hypothetical protein